LALAGHPARQVREPGPGFSTAHPCAGEKESTSCRLPLRGLSTPTHRRTGAPGRAAGHPGPHSSEVPNQQPEQQPEQQRIDASLRLWLRLLLPGFITECGPGWHAALPGAPLQRRAGGGKARRVVRMDANQFGVSTGCAVDKPRNPAADLVGRMPARRVSGVPLSLVPFSRASERKELALRRRTKALLLICSCTAENAVYLIDTARWSCEELVPTCD